MQEQKITIEGMEITVTKGHRPTITIDFNGARFAIGHMELGIQSFHDMLHAGHRVVVEQKLERIRNISKDNPGKPTFTKGFSENNEDGV